MENIEFGVTMMLMGSFGFNYILFKMLKRVEEERDNNRETYTEKSNRLLEKLIQKNTEICDLKNKEIKLYKELEETYSTIERNKFAMDEKEEELVKAEMKYTALKYDANSNFMDLKKSYDLLQDTKLKLTKEFEQLEKSHKKLEVDLYNLDWAYDELMKCYNSNAMDLYFWNLLPKADRETRRRFLKNGKYRVCNLNTGELVFEVV
ncbi:MAG: hypothetical protein ACRCXX_09785 [Cetobacterium sp.]|uniref:hypothetical protein n=1 Tax=Cetobacterium sp. TaxID=2071632 RepID=UPI003F41A521